MLAVQIEHNMTVSKTLCFHQLAHGLLYFRLQRSKKCKEENPELIESLFILRKKIHEVMTC